MRAWAPFALAFSGLLATLPAMAGSITGKVLNFGLPPGQFGFAIDNAGAFLVYDDSTGSNLYYLDSGGTLQPITAPGGYPVSIFGMNDSAVVVGSAQTDGSYTSGLVWSNGSAQLYAAPGCAGTSLTYINDTGVMIGYCYASLNARSPFVLSGGVYTPILYPGSQLTNAVAVNASGNVVGTYTLPGDNNDHAFLFSNGTYTTIDPGPGRQFVYGITDDGQILVASRSGFDIETYGLSEEILLSRLRIDL